MKTVPLLLFTLLFSLPSHADSLLVDYEVTLTRKDGTTTSTQYQFASDGNRIMIKDSNLPYRDMWLRMGPDYLRLHRIVDSRQTYIGVAPSELLATNSMPNWDALNSPLPAAIVRECSEDSSAAVSCQKNQDGLVSLATIKSGGVTIRWSLSKVSRNDPTLESMFHSADLYRSYDFAEVGEGYSPELVELAQMVGLHTEHHH